jgi:hypothetical protein
MDIEMKTPSFPLRCATICSAVLFLLPLATIGAVDDQQFNELKELINKLAQKVEKQDQRIEQLEKTHAQDAQAHDQDQKKIQELEQKLGETQQTVSNVQQTAASVVPAEPGPRMPLDEASVNHNFLIVGDAEVQYGRTAGQHASFELADFAPIFLYRAGNDVLFEAGFDIMNDNNVSPRSPGYSTSLNLTFATLDYVLNPYMTLEAGQMLVPLGTYNERNAGWLNKIPDDPLVRDDLLPETGVGVQLRGAFSLGQSGQSLTYAVYGDNGPSSGTGTTLAGDLDLNGNVGNTPNWHANPSGGGRLGWFIPWKPHYDFELGLSGQTGAWSDSGRQQWSAAVVDAALHLGANIEVKGEYITTWVGSTDLGTIRPNGWWIQPAYKLAGLNLNVPYIGNVELVSRYDRENNAQGSVTDRYTAGGIYYISNALLLEADYEWFLSHGLTPLYPFANRFILQLSYGF